MGTLQILLAQTKSEATIEILFLLLVSAIIGYHCMALIQVDLCKENQSS